VLLTVHFLRDAEVAASGINSLDHYHQHGWHEGRDPSVSFDTGDYLAHYPDVAASGADPLIH
jgi:serralysin